MNKVAEDRIDRRARRLNDATFERFRNRRSRRALAVTLCGLMALEAVLLIVMDQAPLLFGGALVVLIGLFVICLGALKASTRGVEELPTSALDERQAQVRGLAYAKAYQIGCALLSLELLAVFAWIVLELATPSSGIVIAALVVTFQSSIVLPTLVIAATQDV
ncbi:MAG: hypothetical protein ACRDZO_17715 [Egibacteraceae bacterium]